MKVLLINGSPHEHGCTRAALDEVARTLSECGVETELINLGAGPFSGCRACGGCAKTGRCVIADDAPEITAAMHDADVIAFATPIYYYELSGQLKTLLDRSNSLFDSDYALRTSTSSPLRPRRARRSSPAQRRGSRAGSSALSARIWPGRPSPGASTTLSAPRAVPRWTRPGGSARA